MEFLEYLFGIEINGHMIAKYIDGEKIVLAHEINSKQQAHKMFNSEEAFDTALDAAVDDNDFVFIFNHAAALNSVLKAFFGVNLDSDDSDDYGDDDAYGKYFDN